MAQKTTQVSTAETPAVPQKSKKIDVLKNMLNAESVQDQFKNALGKNSGTFIASVIDLYNSDSNLQLCAPKQVVMEALKAAILKLPINKALGYAYIIPYGRNVKEQYYDNKGQLKEGWTKVMEPTFQMGYKGYIQLAMRTGEYRILNADVVYEGELREVSKLTGEIHFDGKKTSDKIVGYFCYFELRNGFAKTLYMTVEQIAAHAKKYAKGLPKDTTVESLTALAELPFKPDASSTAVGWKGNFHSMAIKTVIRNLLSKYGYLSIEMQNAISEDYRGDVTDEGAEDQSPIVLDPDDVDYDEVNTPSAIEQPQPESELDPGY